MYTFSNKTTIECCLSISICFMLLFYQSITSQTSITFLFVLNYEFPLVFLFPFVFVIPFIPLPFPFPTIPDLIPFPMIKCGYENGRGVFTSVSVRFHPYSLDQLQQHTNLYPYFACCTVSVSFKSPSSLPITICICVYDSLGPRRQIFKHFIRWPYTEMRETT
jgi:uncharacterized Zn-finger protein